MPPQTAVAPQRRSMDTISIWALVATIIVSIFVYFPSASVPFPATKTFLLAAGALITLAVYILARLSRGNVIFPPWLLLGALWLPTLAYAISATFSGVSFTNAFWGSALESDTLGFMLVASVLGSLTALMLRRSEQYRVFLRVGAFVFCAVAVVEILALFLGQIIPSTISPMFSVLGSYDDLAYFLGLGVVSVLIAFRFLSITGRNRTALIIAGSTSLLLLALANSSLVWTLVALVSLGLFVESVMRRSTGSSDADLDDVGGSVDTMPAEGADGNHSLVMPLATLAISLFFLIGGTLGGALASALHVNSLSVRPSWQSTLSIAQKTYATSPVFGTGPGTFGIGWLKYRDASLNTTVFWNTDFTSGIGFIPTSFVTTGIVGALAWIGFLGLLLVFGLRMLIQRAPKDESTRHLAILSFVGALYLFAIAVFGLPNPVLIALAFIFAGLFASTMRFAEGSGQWGVIFSRNPRIGFVIVFSLTILLLGSVVAAYTLVGHYLSTTQLAYASNIMNTSGDLDAAEKSLKNSLAFAPSANAYQAEAGIANLRLNKILSSTDLTPVTAQQQFQSALSSGISAALTATKLAPSNYQNWIILGNLYAQALPLGVSGAYDNAKNSFTKAQELNPTNPQIPYILAQLNIANKNNKEAKENLKTAIGLKQDFTAAIFLLSQLEVQDGNVKDALAAALAAAYFTPSDPNILYQVGILRAASSDLPGAAEALNAAIAVNPSFAIARYFLSAVYAKQGDLKSALVQMQAVADISAENATAVTSQLAALTAGKNPFPANLLTISPPPAEATAPAAAP